ncbi:unnamed protein product [Orchesella dallaii]|uniref:Uncharacterized protein n=1 Tax=Orchesella dallaii TaxID=48710 RepID=A0ABP1S7B3_9HEXA
MDKDKPIRPMVFVKRCLQQKNRKDPIKEESNSAPSHFLHPFADPNIFIKIKKDRRTRSWLDDEQYVNLIKEIQGNLDVFDERFNEPAHQPKIVMTLRVLLLGRQGYVTENEKPQLQDTRTLPPDLINLWIAVLHKVEGLKLEKETEVRQAANVAFKARDFTKALEMYNKAIEIFPFDMRCYMNIGAIHFETKNYTECISQCIEAVEVGRENSAFPHYVAKAFLRIGKAYQKLGNFESAKKFYKKSADEDNTTEALRLLLEMENLIYLKNVNFYASHQEAWDYKCSGNALFLKGNYVGAAEYYTKAISLYSQDSKLYNNRAECYIKLTKLDLAMKDCEKCLELQRDNAQGWLLKARILQYQTMIAFEKASELDSSDKVALKGFQQSLLAINLEYNCLDME